tara:strand:- start:206 stop:562 length:357 start_codon:yes stop_codon:yes gene_type:complete
MAPQPLPSPGLKLERLQRHLAPPATPGLDFEIIEAGTNAPKLKSINIANSNASSGDVIVSLFINNNGSEFFIIRKYTITYGTRFFVDMKDINLKTTVGNDSLFLRIDNAGQVDVIIST